MHTENLEKKLEENIAALSQCLSKLKKARSIFEKIEIFDRHPLVEKFLKQDGPLRSFLTTTSPENELLIKQLVAIGQADELIPVKNRLEGDEIEKIQGLLKWLAQIEHFYREIGGILGYHIQMLEFLSQNSQESYPSLEQNYHPPKFIDISKAHPDVDQSIIWGLEYLPWMAEFYPLGGAADRLHLLEEKTGKELPAAKLKFGESTLLEVLIRDLQGREYLYYKLKGKQVNVPIAIMTSTDKKNHDHVLSICEEKSWFYRPKDRFQFFTQPLVPALLENGDWCIRSAFQPLCKPGGHGIIWKLANDEGVIDWLVELGCKKALIRQINNPIAGLDYGLLAFTGWGCNQDSVFGFASCPRLKGVAEGINVLIEKTEKQKSSYVLSNIEYCDFKRYKNQKDLETSPSFSSNTNILFADLKALQSAVKTCPFPGTLINVKPVQFTDALGNTVEKRVARLESTMQNIADVFVETHPEPLQEAQVQKTFVTYNERHKTISTAKKVYSEGGPTLETPERCFFDRLSTYHELLSKHCSMQMPAMGTVEEYFQNGPTFVVDYHPALGPLFPIIAQKIHRGSMSLRSYLSLEIAELDLENLDLDGSLRIEADRILGHVDENQVIQYSEKNGKCTLKNVKVRNFGIDWEKSQKGVWKNQVQHKESLKIILHGNAEFYAADVVLQGDLQFEVPNNYSMEISSNKNGGYTMKQKYIKEASWYYEYQLTDDFQVKLVKKNL